MKRFSILVFYLSILLPTISHSQSSNKPEFLNDLNSAWVDSVFNSLSAEERIGQLFMLAAYTTRDTAFENRLSFLIDKYRIGGLVFFAGTPERQVNLTNRYQKESKVPLLIGLDAEWGAAMRLSGIVKFPYQMTLGAIVNDSSIYNFGVEVGKQMKMLGVHVNFAPCVDINNNPNNPVIGFRSFGDNTEMVINKAIAYSNGMTSQRILTTMKHFPGHGDTDVDSHKDLPQLNISRQRMDSVELVPFNKMIANRTSCAMVAHLQIPTLDSTANLPGTLSRNVVTCLLKEQMGFEGLVFTDALDMKGVTKFYQSGELECRALEAGNDMLVMTEDVPRAVDSIKKAIENQKISQYEIDTRCRKILAAKYWAGLSHYEPIDTTDLTAKINTQQAKLLNRKLVENSITVLKNENDLLPVADLEKLRIASVSIGVNSKTLFQSTLEKYAPIDTYILPKNATDSAFSALKQSLSAYNLIIIGLHNLSIYKIQNFGINDTLKTRLSQLLDNQNTMLTIFGSVYTLTKLDSIENAKAIVLTYQENAVIQDVAAQIIFGGVGAKGYLPVTVSKTFHNGFGITTQDGFRLKYTLPEELEIDSKYLSERIDSVVNRAIELHTFPGCQVLAAKDGKVFFNKAYGTHTYEDTTKVCITDIYDLASVTKISATLPALMQLYDIGKWKLDDKVSEYWTELKKSNKENITFREVLTHTARLVDWIPFWKQTLDKNGKFKPKTFKTKYSSSYPTKVAENLYLHKKYEHEIFNQIIKSPLNEKKEYKYSDLGFYIFPKVIEKQSHSNFEKYVEQNFYKPLGANSLVYNAYQHFPLERIIPTENDSIFRKTLIHGQVHDEGAAMLNGISGHAGLFGNANDMAKLMQMYLQKGYYAGKHYINRETINEFTRCQFCEEGNRRGLGFDKPFINNSSKKLADAYPAPSTSAESFGHSGFTGTFVWVDPANGLIFIFLSNRVYPTRANNKIVELNIRPTLHQIFYDAIKRGIK